MLVLQVAGQGSPKSANQGRAFVGVRLGNERKRVDNALDAVQALGAKCATVRI